MKVFGIFNFRKLKYLWFQNVFKICQNKAATQIHPKYFKNVSKICKNTYRNVF